MEPTLLPYIPLEGTSSTKFFNHQPRDIADLPFILQILPNVSDKVKRCISDINQLRYVVVTAPLEEVPQIIFHQLLNNWIDFSLLLSKLRMQYENGNTSPAWMQTYRNTLQDGLLTKYYMLAGILNVSEEHELRCMRIFAHCLTREPGRSIEEERDLRIKYRYLTESTYNTMVLKHQADRYMPDRISEIIGRTDDPAKYNFTAQDEIRIRSLPQHPVLVARLALIHNHKLENDGNIASPPSVDVGMLRDVQRDPSHNPTHLSDFMSNDPRLTEMDRAFLRALYPDI
ncbi:hypothetical protein BTUL_0313g00070 [Botrytis tulipae]|uniref:Uncharacterized protein n=1 Tax=Botrytis tulipae TaxID=87230 RepID=A0A4Z1E748_9HELO|nr:hypothetical protein BTUL_0313g00070 [Botrytis tulipae]